MSEPVAASPTLTSEQFRDVIGCFASGVTVITTATAHGWGGATASSVASLSLEPPMLIVCINAKAATAAAISQAGAFAVNILAEDQDQIALRFARREPEKFRGIACRTGCYGEPLLDGALAQLECRVLQSVTGGTHIVFLSRVEHARAREGRPLAYFRGRFGELNVATDSANRQPSMWPGLVDLGLMAA